MADLNDIYNEINRIENAKEGIAKAIEEKGIQVPAGTPIQNFPAKVREIQTGSPDAVLYTPQDLTPEQQEQARENIGAGTYTKPDTGIPKSDFAPGVQTSLENADTALQPAALTPITELIPVQATPQNQLADKNFVNSSVATNTANYISDNGQPFQSVADLEAYTGTLTNNDYAFVVGTDSAGNTTYTRYKYNANTQTWAAEYVLNNSSFTAEQWAAISSGITALLVQKLSDLPTEVVTYVAQTLTEAQKQQARTNIGATAPEIFWATYGTTTAAEIDAAIAAGKAVFVNGFNNNNRIYVCVGKIVASATYNFYVFVSHYNDQMSFVRVRTDNDVWASGQWIFEQTANKVSTLSGNETSTTKYPSTKAVADALGKMGVISQTIQWFTSENSAQDYNILNPVTGLIPQANIDLYEAAGAVFNDQTGYFELNGLTDIAYDEMKRIYAKSIGGAVFSVNKNSQFAQYDERTTVVLKFPNGYSTSINHMFTYSTIRVAYLADANNLGSIYNTFNASPRVETIIGAIAATGFNNVVFSGCYSLKNVTISKLRSDVYFSQSSRLTLDSVVYMVENATNTTAISITLHATAFARCQADTTTYTYEGQTYTGIIAYAAAKNITIQSA